MSRPHFGGTVLSTDLGDGVSSVSGATFLPDGRLLMTTTTPASAEPSYSIRGLDGTMTTVHLPAGGTIYCVLEAPEST